MRPMGRRRRFVLLFGVWGTLATAGCSPRPQTPGLAGSAGPIGTSELASTVATAFDPELELHVAPPQGWTLDPVKRTSQHIHKTWISPTGHTAYGVIRFRLPIPVSDDLALWGFLREMRRTEGEAVLLEKTPGFPLADGLKVLSFTAEGGRYRVRTLLVTRGFRGWCVYAGTLREQPVQEHELDTALRHRNALRLPG